MEPHRRRALTCEQDDRSGPLVSASFCTLAITGLTGVSCDRGWGRIADRSTNRAELEQEVYAGLLADNAGTIAGIVDGARAAIAAVDLAAVPVIAELSRLHLQEGCRGGSTGARSS